MHTPIHAQSVSRDKSCFVLHKHQDSPGNIFRETIAPERRQIGHHAFYLFRKPGRGLGQREPGSTIFTRMPAGPSSSASIRINASSADLATL
jgi:hypothetical protein